MLVFHYEIKFHIQSSMSFVYDKVLHIFHFMVGDSDLFKFVKYLYIAFDMSFWSMYDGFLDVQYPDYMSVSMKLRDVVSVKWCCICVYILIIIEFTVIVE